MEEGLLPILNRTIHYNRAGNKDNQTLVLMHGLGRDLHQWDFVFESLSKDFDVVAFDLLGYGLSGDLDNTEINITFPIWVMERVFDELELKDVVLLGESFGGLLALEYTIKNPYSKLCPNRIKKLILMDSAGLGRKIAWGWRLATIPILGEAIIETDALYPEHDGIPIKQPGVSLRLFANFLKYIFLRWTKWGRIKDRLSRKDYNNIRLLRYAVNMRGQKDAVNRYDVLNRISVPTLILHGLEDNIFPLAQAKRAYKKLKKTLNDKVVFYLFIDATHFPAGDCPEEFIKVVKEFCLREFE